METIQKTPRCKHEVIMLRVLSDPENIYEKVFGEEGTIWGWFCTACEERFVPACLLNAPPKVKPSRN
jgi:hypothetical protein